MGIAFNSDEFLQYLKTKLEEQKIAEEKQTPVIHALCKSLGINRENAPMTEVKDEE